MPDDDERERQELDLDDETGLLRRQLDADGQPTPEQLRVAIDDFLSLDIDSVGEWVDIGPSPLRANLALAIEGGDPTGMPPIKPEYDYVSGLVTDIAIDPSGNNDDVIYIATAGAGIWKSVNGGQTWTAKTDGLASLAMGSVAIDPNDANVVYAGTGPVFESPSLRRYRSVGLYKSVDGGETWWLLDGGFFSTVLGDAGMNRIVIPQPGVLLVATDKGLFRSVSGGLRFGGNTAADDEQPVLPGRISGLAADTLLPNVVFAAAAGTGLLRSRDGGTTFPENLFNKPGAPRSYNDVVFAQSTLRNRTSDNCVIFASVQTKATGYVGLFQWSEPRQTWQLRPAAKDVEEVLGVGPNQTNYDFTIGVDPQDPDRVYIGFQTLWCSPNGGSTFFVCDSFRKEVYSPGLPKHRSAYAYPVHVDHHALAFSPRSHWAANDPKRQSLLAQRRAEYQDALADPSHQNPKDQDFYKIRLTQLAKPRTTIFVGTDGGIYRNASPEADLDGWQDLNQGGIGSGLVYGIDSLRNQPPGKSVTYAGFQDNGTAVADAAPLGWSEYSGGDGLQVAVDPSDPVKSYVFTTTGFSRMEGLGGPAYTPGNIQYSEMVDGKPEDIPFRERCLAIDRISTDTTQRNIYVGVGNILYCSRDGATTFPISKDFKKRVICVAALPQESALRDKNRVWVGLKGGEIHYSDDAGTTWDKGDFTSDLGATGSIEAIAVDPKGADGKRIVAVTSGYSEVTPVYRTLHVFLSKDGGKSWSDISGQDLKGPKGNVPDIPVNSVVFDGSTTPSRIIIATSAGVLSTRDDGANWKVHGVGLPMVECMSLAIDGTVSPPILRVGTYGRGCWELKPAESANDARLSLPANAAFGFVGTGTTTQITLRGYNTGSKPLTIVSVDSANAPAGITLDPFPTTWSLGAEVTLTLKCQPGATAGDRRGFFVIHTNDPNPEAAAFKLFASATAVDAPLAPRLGLQPRALNFGRTTTDGRTLPGRLLNVGLDKLALTSFKYAGGDKGFEDPTGAGLLAPIDPGAERPYQVTFKPTRAFSVFFANPKFSGNYSVLSNDVRSTQYLPASGVRDGGVFPLLEIILILTGVGLLVLGAVELEELIRKA